MMNVLIMKEKASDDYAQWCSRREDARVGEKQEATALYFKKLGEKMEANKPVLEGRPVGFNFTKHSVAKLKTAYMYVPKKQWPQWVTDKLEMLG